MPMGEGMVRMLQSGAVYCQVCGCGSVAAYLLSSDVPDCVSRVEAYCEFHAAQFRAAGSSPRPTRKPSGAEMGLARTLTAKA